MISRFNFDRKWVHIAILSALYYASARLGLLFAIPPGVATPIWPPSGISVAYLFTFGLELWPGVLIGSVLANYRGPWTLENVALPLLIAIGSTIYILVVVQLLKQKLDLGRWYVFSKKSMLLALRVGPLAGLVSSVWGTSALLIMNKIDWSKIPFTWFNWWLGDIVGVFIFLPLCLLGTSQYQQYRRPLLKLVVMPLSISIIICLGVFLFVQGGSPNSGPLMSWMILIFSLMLTCLLELLLLTVVLRNIQIEALVHEKTLHLQHMNQQLEDALRAKSEFLSNMSHEIRTPLNSILGMAQVLNETPLDEEQKKYVEVFNRSGTSLLDLVNDILDWSKLESGKNHLRFEAFLLEELLVEIGDLFCLQAREKGLSFNINMHPQMEQVYQGDRAKIKQILVNLIGNAIKFTEKGSVDVSVSPSGGFCAGNVLFEIKDTGIGITEGQRESLFNVFTQADSSITKRYGGTGLGLAISKKLVELMNGKIDATSTYGVGSQFSFTLPLDVQKGILPTALASLKINDSVLGRKKILLVDDLEENRILVKLFLKNYDFVFVEAENGKIAVDYVAQQAFDLILMDVQMLVMDGYTAVRAIRGLEKQRRLFPTAILAITACVSEEDRQKSLNAGCDEHISKPIQKTEFISRIEYWCSRISPSVKKASSI